MVDLVYYGISRVIWNRENRGEGSNLAYQSKLFFFRKGKDKIVIHLFTIFESINEFISCEWKKKKKRNLNSQKIEWKEN